MIYATSSGSFDRTTKALEFMQSGRMFSILNHYGQVGVDALSRATPKDTGETAHSWRYEVFHRSGVHVIQWYNTHREGNGYVNIAVIIQYGHGTGTGGYVQGRDYINPAMRPIFDKIVNDVWREVQNA